MHRLLNDLVLGDKKSSQLLREMKDLAVNSINEEMLHNLWVSRLPTTIRPLPPSDALKLDVLAEMADRLMETVTLNKPILSSSRSSLETQMTELQSAMAFCMKEILDMKKQ